MELGSRPSRGDDQEKIVSATKLKTYTVRASKEEPQYLIKSDKTDHMAMPKGSALKRILRSQETKQIADL